MITPPTSSLCTNFRGTERGSFGPSLVRRFFSHPEKTPLTVVTMTAITRSILSSQPDQHLCQLEEKCEPMFGITTGHRRPGTFLNLETSVVDLIPSLSECREPLQISATHVTASGAIHIRHCCTEMRTRYTENSNAHLVDLEKTRFSATRVNDTVSPKCGHHADLLSCRRIAHES